MPDFRPAIRTRFDVVDFGLFGAFTLSIILGLQNLSQDSLHASGGFFGIAVSALALYWLHASRSQYPLFALSLFRLRSFSVGIGGSLVSRLGSGAMPFLTPLMMQVGLGHSPSIAGMSMIPLTVSGMATKPFISGMIRRFGYRAVLSCRHQFDVGVYPALDWPGRFGGGGFAGAVQSESGCVGLVRRDGCFLQGLFQPWCADHCVSAAVPAFAA